jgi:hypothetical protein
VHLPDGEPSFGPWRVRNIGEDPAAGGGAPPLAVDGRSGSGKTTVGPVARRVPGAAVVHTDDIARYHAMFDWSL